MSEVKVNKISPRTNCGTVQLGDSGDTITIPSGATITNNGTQTGFGRTGTVDWQTTVKTADFTAVSGEGYFVNTTSGEIIVTLPTGSAGDIIAVKDYGGTFDTNTCRLSPAGSDKINGTADDAYLQTQGVSVTLVFTDSTKGWLAVNDSTEDTTGLVPAFVAATGGTVTTDGDFKIHVFTGPGTFCVSCAGNSAGANTVDYIVTAGGGGGGRTAAGGAGGLRFASSTYCAPACTSPRAGSAIPVTATAIPITVGGGGSGMPANPSVPVPSSNYPTKGNNSVFSTITSAGGGAAFRSPHATTASNGGSGGGGAPFACRATFGQGNTPPVSPPQGFPSTDNPSLPACTTSIDGGGAGGNTANTSPQPTPRTGAAGLGFPTDIMKSCAGVASPSPTVRFLAGGGGGGSHVSPSTFTTAQHGGGNGGGATPGPGNPSTPGSNGTANTGGGGGGGGAGTGRSTQPPQGGGGDGGSGIVIIRYKFQ